MSPLTDLSVWHKHLVAASLAPLVRRKSQSQSKSSTSSRRRLAPVSH